MRVRFFMYSGLQFFAGYVLCYFNSFWRIKQQKIKQKTLISFSFLSGWGKGEEGEKRGGKVGSILWFMRTQAMAPIFHSTCPWAAVRQMQTRIRGCAGCSGSVWGPWYKAHSQVRFCSPPNLAQPSLVWEYIPWKLPPSETLPGSVSLQATSQSRDRRIRKMLICY